MKSHAATRRNPGSFTALNYKEGVLIIRGWTFDLEREEESLEVFLNGRSIGKPRRVRRDEVTSAFTRRSGIERSGFELEADVPPEVLHDWADIEAVTFVGGEPSGNIAVRYRADFQHALPADVPADLQYRKAFITTGVDVFWLGALQSYDSFVAALERYGGTRRVRKLLDWGVGCGRTAALCLKFFPWAEVHGCDVDREGVEFCSRALPGGHFAVIDLAPPTGYEDNAFDTVLACSVFTHLTRQCQLDWLREMKRVLMPGGLFLASVNSSFAATNLDLPESVKAVLRRDEFSDSAPDQTHEGILPQECYRETFQTEAYTRREFGRYFEIVDYIPLGMHHYQDLVVMQKA
jgi:SAM-dependent methyltransferase